MNDASEKKPGLLRRIGSSLSRRLVARVPDEVSCCEFDCRKTECAQGNWEECPVRLDYARRLRDGHCPDREQS